MRRTLTTLLLAGIAPVAGAHTLDSGVMTALGHELLGAHHLPFTILLVVVGFALYKIIRRSGFAQRGRTASRDR